MKPVTGAPRNTEQQGQPEVVSGRMMTGNLGYFVRVEGSGPPVLLLHGFTGSHESFQEVTEVLRQNFTVVRPDMPGHAHSVVGKSQKWSMDTVAFGLFRLMRELGFPTFSCVGYSMGGRIALSMAARAPERLDCVVVESGSPGLETKAQRMQRMSADEALAKRMESIGLEAFVNEWEGQPLFATEMQLPTAIRERQRSIRLSHLVTGLASSLRHMGTGAQEPVWPFLSALNLPILLMTGQKDKKFSEIGKRMGSLLPQAEHHIVAGAGHDIHLEEPYLFLEKVSLFLAHYATTLPISHSGIRGTMFADEEDH